MNIIPLGKIFDPTDHALPNGCAEFAQSPQTLVFDDFIRIYFSTRARDATGKFISHVAFVDMDKSLSNILRVSEHSVIAPGDLGAFDEHGIFPFHVMDNGDEIFAYTTGWSRRVSVSVETGIGLAISRDRGESFVRLGPGPILTASMEEPCLVGDAFVRKIDGQFHMWYIFGLGWKRFPEGGDLERIYKIGHTTSANGIVWESSRGRAIIDDALGADESQALPTVIESNGLFHLFFCYRESFNFRITTGRGYRLGYAKSSDLRTWQRADSELPLEIYTTDWDSNMQCYPHVFQCDGRIFLLYNGNEFGRFGFGAAELLL
jgi:hypothetical protein